ncbi:MAG: PEP/pyruvate-binding domain-containing protein [Desulfocapsaceae bacterium]|nr:PEP/pyruvate-binding domain-containing protein [Desulfocapsaceae bacterium]
MIRIWKRLNKGKVKETQGETALKKKYNEFLSVLLENEQSLDLMTRLEVKLYNSQLISLPYLKGMIGNLSKRIANIIESVIQLSGGEYVALRDTYGRLDRDIRYVLTGRTEPIYTPIIIPLEAVGKELADKVGNKMANLGEMRNRCGQTIPVGFAATACAYTHFIEYNDLSAKIDEVLSELGPDDNFQLLEAENTIKNLFLQAKIPPEIEQVILHEAEKLEKERGRPLFWAVRSSAIGEDLAESSFAGQFSTVLNVPTDRLLHTYKEVAASKYNAQVIVYQRMKNIHDGDVTMSVGFMEMIDPVCSGVAYSLNPVRPDNQEMVINAVWGIGELLVDGSVSADMYVLKRDSGFPLVHEETAEKAICLTGRQGGGLQQVVMPEGKSNSRCLNKDQLERLADMAMRIEGHLQGPQDIEWCFDHQDTLYMLQARPLRICEKAEPANPAVPVEAVIVASQTQPISSGVGWGKVFKATSIHDLTSLPQGAILVLKHSSPRFIGALRKTAAVIIENGNWTDHMASVVREFRVPCLVRVAGIFDSLQNGQDITVDADEGIIYAGIVSTLQSRTMTSFQDKSVSISMTESHRLIKNIAEYIFPLHLTDPRRDDFSPEACRSWHDILRFCHETALNEMFLLKEKSGFRSARNIFRVKTNLPITLYVFDILGNVIQGNHRDGITAEDIQSRPFQRLWEGMTAPEVNWRGPDRRMETKDLVSAMLRAPMSAAAQPVDTKSYAVAAPWYLNMSLSMGYHYIVLDCYLSDDAFNNYISLSFKGGAAEARKRSLRVAFVAEILKHMDFNVTTSNDFLKARLKAESAEELGKKLNTIGHMLGVTRLLDLAMEDESMVENCVARFEAHDYSLGVLSRG